MKTIQPRQISSSATAPFLLDVRTPAEYEEVHIEGSALHPLPQLNAADVKAAAQEREVCVICRTGNRAQQAAQKLATAGLTNIAVMEGGVEAWSAAGLPVKRGRKTISLERQVRIGAGALVLIGAILGYLVHPAFIGLSAFVGAGLIFAGVTDWCGMAMVLARMPWNNMGNVRSCSIPSQASNS